MRKFNKTSLLHLIVLAGLVFSHGLSIGHAQTPLLTASYADTSSGGGNITTTAASGPISTGFQGVGFNVGDFAVSVGATADYGYISGNASTSGLGGESAQSDATFADLLTISAFGHEGEVGIMYFTGQLSGHLRAGVSNAAFGNTISSVRLLGDSPISLSLSSPGQGIGSDQGPYDPITGNMDISQTFDQAVTGSCNFVFGTPFNLSLGLEIGAHQERYGPAVYETEQTYGSFTWGGITDIVTTQGSNTSVTNATQTSASGFNYSLAYSVPEPSSFATLSTGLAALGFVFLRRRRN